MGPKWGKQPKPTEWNQSERVGDRTRAVAAVGPAIRG